MLLVAVLILLCLLLFAGNVESENKKKDRIEFVKNEEVIKLKEKTIQIVPGESNYDRKIREAEEKRLKELERQRKLALMPEWKWQIVEITKKYDWDWRVASAVFYGESGLNPDAYNSIGACGVVQLYRCPPIDWKNPEVNIDYAYHNKYLKGGWRHWVVWQTGAYRQYLNWFN